MLSDPSLPRWVVLPLASPVRLAARAARSRHCRALFVRVTVVPLRAAIHWPQVANERKRWRVACFSLPATRLSGAAEPAQVLAVAEE